jgi:putative phosphonate metabolism protein
MTNFRRFAIYYAPRPGAFAAAAAQWLGRDVETGALLAQPAPEGLAMAEITAEARKYGFHGTIRAPFRPAEGLDAATIRDAVEEIATRLPVARADGLQIENLHGFFALTPRGDAAAIRDLAARVVEATDPLRAPLTEAEIARRNPDRLSPHQRALLDRWGYPYVMDELRFHLTLTGRLEAALHAPVTAAIAAQFEGLLPAPFAIEDLCLFGEEAATGQFQLLHRYPLLG